MSAKPPLCKHRLAVCSQCVIVTDAAKRMSDAINGVLVFCNYWEVRNHWMAFALADGASDKHLYPDRETAMRFQLRPDLCAYICMKNLMGGAKPFDCQVFLNMYRHAYDNGGRLAEPEAPQLILPTAYYDRITGRRRG